MFPRTQVGGISVPRMIIGTNWFFGFSHYTRAKDEFIKTHIKNPKVIADILEVFFRAGVTAVMGEREPLAGIIEEAQDRTGVKAAFISTPSLPVKRETAASGFEPGELERLFDRQASLGVDICMPHTTSTDMLVDRCTREVRQMGQVCRLIRERGMLPGLSTHLPETIVFADETDLDVETYIAIYNSMGFLMPLEVDWTAEIIRNAKKPVMTIKPMAAGHIRPFQALNFVWNTLRPCDMVTVGTMSPDEAKELIDLSLSIIEQRKPDIELQETRSKSTVKPK